MNSYTPPTESLEIPLWEEEYSTFAVNIIEEVSLSAGDILHVQLGIQDMGDGMGPWIPTPIEVEEAQNRWQKIVPEGVIVHVTHFGENPQIIKVDVDE